MNYKQSLKIAMFQRVSLFFTKNDAILKLFAFLYGLIGDFQTALANVEPTLEQQAADTTGLTKTKEQALADVVALLVPMSRKAFAWAKVKKNEVLKALFDIHNNNFSLASPGQDDLTLVNNVLTGLSENATALLEANITQAQIDAVIALAVIFKNTLGTPQQAKKETTAATVSLDEQITDLSDKEETCYELLVNEYGVSNHQMALDYEATRKIGTAVKRHTTLHVGVYLDEAKTIAVKGAVVSIVERNRNEETDYQGMAEIVQFMGGKLTLLTKATGHPDKETPFQIKTGDHIDIDIVLS